MKRIKIDAESADLLERLMKERYVIGEGRQTRQIVRALGSAGIDVYNGYDTNAKKVILAIERGIPVVLRTRTLNLAIFDLDLGGL